MEQNNQNNNNGTILYSVNDDKINNTTKSFLGSLIEKIYPTHKETNDDKKDISQPLTPEERARIAELRLKRFSQPKQTSINKSAKVPTTNKKSNLTKSTSAPTNTDKKYDQIMKDWLS
ncbi:putative ORFan [Tupanvirus deep ocean]|uniref:ORFan n=2 Tax=Tupanvirus TaxID=2094720 RepID=A0AC62A790_9VIRU|nr:putative ORFan [Tupanvirus deep ocean]QKU33647.1 putative ORFan [Tupanvirus deep ocean]